MQKRTWQTGRAIGQEAAMEELEPAEREIAEILEFYRRQREGR
jgi:hypothetical protein